MSEPVYFCEPRYYPLSNFSAFQLEWKGRVWQTSEHAFQSEKFTDPEIIAKLERSRSVDEAYRIAQAYKMLRRPDWNEVKVKIMKDIFMAKLHQHPTIKDLLLESGDRQIIKDSAVDGFWGWGSDGKGENMMGKLWMEIRAELRKGAIS